MSETRPLPAGSETFVTVRYWASARAAAGTAADRVPVPGEVTLADVTASVLDLRSGTPAAERLEKVLGACSVLVGEDPVGTRDPAAVVVRPGDSVEFLPPFAGG